MHDAILGTWLLCVPQRERGETYTKTHEINIDG